MRQTLHFIFLALFFAGTMRALEVGDTDRDVVSAWGNPVAVRKKADGEQVWRFRDGATVWVAADGVVQKIVGRSVGNTVKKPGSTAWVSLKAAERPAQNSLQASAGGGATGSAVKLPPLDDKQALRYFVVFGGLAVSLGLMMSVFRSGTIVLRTAGEWVLDLVLVPVLGFFLPALVSMRSRTKRIYRDV